MGYTGYVERICTNGHYYTSTTEANADTKCRYCKAASEFEHEVDITNGYGELGDGSYTDENAPKTIVGWVKQPSYFGKSSLAIVKPDLRFWVGSEQLCKFVFFWRDGGASVQKADTATAAFAILGREGSIFNAVDHYCEVTPENKNYHLSDEQLKKVLRNEK